VYTFVTRCFLQWEVVYPSPNPQAGGPHLICCLWLIIRYIRS